MKAAALHFMAAALLWAAPSWAQVSMRQDAAAAPAAKGGFVEAEERKPLSPQTAAILRGINAYRAAGATCGGVVMPPAPPLDWHDALERAAAAHLKDMVASQGGGISHNGSDGSGVGQRVTRQGYEWGGAGENVAAGDATALGTLAQWMRSPGHCRNMMGQHFRHVAVSGGAFAGTTYGHYWVMVLAAPLR